MALRYTLIPLCLTVFLAGCNNPMTNAMYVPGFEQRMSGERIAFTPVGAEMANNPEVQTYNPDLLAILADKMAFTSQASQQWVNDQIAKKNLGSRMALVPLDDAPCRQQLDDFVKINFGSAAYNHEVRSLDLSKTLTPQNIADEAVKACLAKIDNRGANLVLIHFIGKVNPENYDINYVEPDFVSGYFTGLRDYYIPDPPAIKVLWRSVLINADKTDVIGINEGAFISRRLEHEGGRERKNEKELPESLLMSLDIFLKDKSAASSN
jgi:hypothetical protein